METNIIYNEDCFETLKRLRDNSIDAIVTDPPYHLGFMGKNWDKTGIAERVDLWQECLRVLKPGGNLLSFGGTRTSHRIACAIEDAGFEIRDCIMWIYGSGFPKSLNIGKAIDKCFGADREIIGDDPEAKRRNKINSPLNPNEGWNNNSMGSGRTCPITTPATPEAKLWEGYGTGLKPAYEPIVLAMKPLDGTFAENCLKWGVGGLNIEECRIPLNGDKPQAGNRTAIFGTQETISGRDGSGGWESNGKGRFPSNFIHDGSQEVMELFPNPHGAGYAKKADKPQGKGMFTMGDAITNGWRIGDSGSAARFFYCAKASKSERGVANNHPTVKPLALMEYLVKLVTRPQHIVLDPFIGSGTTAMACVKTGRHYIGCELDKDYYTIALKRIKAIEG